MRRTFLTGALVCFGSLAAPDCVQECQQKNRDDVKTCDKLFNSPGSVYYHDTKWHKGCLDQAKTNFDNCMSTCKK
jgi:hypothetical protein